MKSIISHSDLVSKLPRKGKSFLLLYKPDSEQCTCAYNNIERALAGQKDPVVLTADVSSVKDIHSYFGITSVPALLVFVDAGLTNVIKGCQDSSYYKALTENKIFRSRTDQDQPAAKRVTVYSTPTCSWCNTLKTWLQKNSISYTDIDVSRDSVAAEQLVRRSGQQGVPQTDINGQIVVGFNQPRLKELLGIQ